MAMATTTIVVIARQWTGQVIRERATRAAAVFERIDRMQKQGQERVTRVSGYAWRLGLGADYLASVYLFIFFSFVL